jgi:hypothetical protein
MTKDKYKVVLNKTPLHVGMDVELDGKKAKITCLIGLHMNTDYCVIKLEEPDEKGCTILEVKKSLFNYLTQG